MSNPAQPLDALIVGAGFAGICHLHHLRERGFNAKVYESAPSLGGTWYWNAYPGARVDSDYWSYQFGMANLWKGFDFTQRFPARKELVEYFEYVDKTLNLRKDMVFNSRVHAAVFEEEGARWKVSVVSTLPNSVAIPSVVYARFLIVCAGFASIPYYPPYKGLSSFAGPCYHTARWPQYNSSALEVFGGKRVGVIGTGASGVQIVQEAGPHAKHLTVFHRTPQFAIPMMQSPVDEKMRNAMREEIQTQFMNEIEKQQSSTETEKATVDVNNSTSLYATLLRRCKQTFSGLSHDVIPRPILSLSPEERLITLEETWAKGGFHYYTGNFQDLFTHRHASDLIYDFWRRKVHARVKDPVMAEVLAPKYIDHSVGSMRFPCLEQNYYDTFNNDNVTLVDLKKVGIAEILPGGVRMEDGTVHELDVLILATGFGDVTRGIKAIDIKGKEDGIQIGKKWETEGPATYLGVMSHGYPNFFFAFGPQGPTIYCNGPICCEQQGEWIVRCIEHMRSKGHTRIEPTAEAEAKWQDIIREKFAALLWSKPTGNGKIAEQPLSFPGGVPVYERLCQECENAGYEGFAFSGTN